MAMKKSEEISELLTSVEEKEPAVKRFFKSFIPWKGDTVKEIVRKSLLIVSVFAMLISGGYLVANFVVEPYIVNQQISEQVDLLENGSGYKTRKEVENKYKDVEFPDRMQIKYADLYAMNEDFAGWLKIPGANVDMAVVRSKDNIDYLTKDFQKKYTRNGTLFVDCRNEMLNLDNNTVIYGHNINSGILFGKLKNYRSLDTFKKSPIIEYNTLFKDYKWKICSVFITNSKKSDDNGFIFEYYDTELSDSQVHRFGQEIKERSLYETGVDVQPGDKLLTLSTCIYDFDDARLVIVARMVRSNESENVDVEKAYYNSSPRYPQAWYDEKGSDNPYKNSEQWNP